MVKTSMDSILSKLNLNPVFQAFQRQSDQLGNINQIEETLLVFNTYKNKPQPMMIVKSNLYTAQKLYESLSPLLKDKVLLFSVEESMRIEALASSNEIQANKVDVMYRLLHEDNLVCITHISAYTGFLPSPIAFKQHCIELEVNKQISLDTLKQLLFESGYERVTYVDQPQTFASRGGIIDVYSMNYEFPIRIEFFDTEIESIRFFDIATKKTIKTVETITILCASDILFDDQETKCIETKLLEKYDKNRVQMEMDKLKYHEFASYQKMYYSLLDNTYSIKDYFNSDFYIISSYEECLNYHKRIVSENILYIQEMNQMEEMFPIYTIAFEFYSFTKTDMKIHDFVSLKQPIISEIHDIATINIQLDYRLQEIVQLSKTHTVYISVNDYEKEIILSKNFDLKVKFLQIPLIEGFIANLEKIAVYTSKELFDMVHFKAKYDSKFKNAEVLNHYQELEKGDYIVHKLYGVGQYVGIVTKESEGLHKDYLKIAYKGNDILFVPLEQFKLVRKFLSKEGAVPRLNTLGSKEWEKTKAKVQENVNHLASRLVHLYALRDKKIGFAFAADTPLQKQFEDDFDYPLTKDQEQAIKEIKKDMEADVPMDRLLSGDVGFGKTEVALRAAFKAVMSNKQVAFLCPTTILSLQHYHTVLRRVSNFPVIVKVLNRFISSKEAKKIKQELLDGKIDILIGTHRILSKDIQFKDLGLLIIDEEQRFGVEHKEKIKEIKNTIDVLSLSATPIPRTLQMSLVNIRSSSQLNTPPLNRQSVQTYVVEKNLQLIKEVIQRELSRSGQVFYLYNNVKEIYNVAKKITLELKDVRVGVAHGQMSKEEIEDIMYDFINRKYDVLVCTTIIETGIDIPNVNTILIENADTFGLSQLYQIKGRVGRSDRLAYAYLMYAPNKQLTELASKRLKAIKEFAKLGSGYQIALRDLTIRGAGEMLGPKQAGFIDTVGIDMYLEMLSDAIKEEQGIKTVVEEVEEKRANLKLDAYIPKQFEEEDYEKITLYQKIEKVKTRKELQILETEIIDLYGKLPKSVALLFEKRKIDIMLNQEHVESFKDEAKEVKVVYSESWSNQVDGMKLFELATTISKDIRIQYTNQKISFKLNKTKDYLFILVQFLSQIEKL